MGGTPMLACIQKLTPKNRLETPLLRRLRLLLPAAVFVAMAWAGFSLPASASIITEIGTLITGDPCDPDSPGFPPPEGQCDLFEVSNLFEGDSFTVDWDHVEGTDTIDVTATFTMKDVTGNILTLTVEMTNNSTSVGTNSITLLVITTGDEDLSSAATDGTVFDETDINGVFINLAYDVCVFSNLPPTCKGGNVGNGLLGGGGNETFDLTLTSTTLWDEPFALDHFIMKYQGDNSFMKPGTPSNGKVPEPATLLLYGIGLLGLGVFARRPRRPCATQLSGSKISV